MSRARARYWAQTAFPWGQEVSEFEPPTRRRFDAWEISRCAQYDDENGGFYYERINPGDPLPQGAIQIVYTIYGHLPGAGVVALTDCKTRKDAFEILSYLPDLPIWDYTEQREAGR